MPSSHNVRANDFETIMRKLGMIEADHNTLLETFNNLTREVSPFRRDLTALRDLGFPKVSRQETFFDILKDCLMLLLEDPQKQDEYIDMIQQAINDVKISQKINLQKARDENQEDSNTAPQEDDRRIAEQKEETGGDE